jgi:hypothetical protein
MDRNTKLCLLLSDSIRDALFYSEIILNNIPENSLVVASKIYDFDGDYNNDFVIIYQDTINHENSDVEEDYDNPMILAIYFYDEILDSFEVKFHCADLISSEDDVKIDIYSNTLNETLLMIKMEWVYERTELEFFFDRKEMDFILQDYYYTVEVPEDGHMITDYSYIRFREKTISGFDLPIEQVNFEAPTLSSWPNGRWQLPPLSWRR